MFLLISVSSPDHELFVGRDLNLDSLMKSTHLIIFQWINEWRTCHMLLAFHMKNNSFHTLITESNQAKLKEKEPGYQEKKVEWKVNSYAPWVQIVSLPFSSCVTLVNCLHLSEHPLSYLQYGGGVCNMFISFCEHWLLHKVLGKGLAQGKHSVNVSYYRRAGTSFPDVSTI